MEKIVKTENEILNFAKEHGCRIEFVREALNQPELIKQFMEPPYNVSEEGAILGVIAQDMQKKGLLLE